MDTTIIEEKVSNKTKGPIPYLPDEIAIDILCRLPAKHAVICWLVCRRWRDLTFTRDFMDLHFRRNSIPMIIFTSCRALFYNLTILDNWWELPPTHDETTSKEVYRVPFESRLLYNLDVLLSHAGLIVLRLSSVVGLNFIIFNPVNREKVRITLPNNSLCRSEIYGVFLHPLLKEYCSLWKVHTTSKRGSIDVENKILNLGPNDPSFKTISYPVGDRSKRRDTSPLLMDKFLYWMVEIENYKYSGRSDIMEYDITHEEFNVIPCPLPLYIACPFQWTHLLVIDGTFCFVLIPTKTKSLIHINIWRLENRVEQLWTFVSYTFKREIDKECRFFRAISVGDGKVALLFDNRSLHVFDLKQGSMMYCWKQLKINGELSHQMSFASLRNCKSTININIDRDGQVVVV